jgi:hypothetical protein
MKEVLYWDGLISTVKVQNSKDKDVKEKSQQEELLNIDGFAELVEKLLSGQCRNADLEKITTGKLPSNIPLYSARLNDCNRVLFTTLEKDKKKYLLFLECILNHDYQKARFMQPRVLKDFLRKHGAYNGVIQDEQVFTEYDFQSADSLDINSSSSEKNQSPIQYTSMRYAQGKFIKLDVSQENVLKYDCHGPLIINGVPGAGKSLVVQYLMENQYYGNILYTSGIIKLALPSLRNREAIEAIHS